MTALFLLILWTGAGVLLTIGIVGRRVGWEPHCLRCGFCLAGLRASNDAACPECGGKVGRALFQRGRRVRGKRSVTAGTAFLVVAVLTSIPAWAGRSGIPALLRLMPEWYVTARYASALGTGTVDGGPGRELVRRLENATLSEEGIDELVRALSDSVRRYGMVAHDTAESLADSLQGGRVPDASIGSLARSMTALQEERQAPLEVFEVTDLLSRMLEQPSLTAATRAAIVDFLVSFAAASKGRTDAGDLASGISNLALRGGLRAAEYRAIAEASASARLDFERETLWRGDTVRAVAAVEVGAMPIWLRGPDTTLELRSGAVALAATRGSIDAAAIGAEAWVTVPDAPGRHVLKVTVVAPALMQDADLTDAEEVAPLRIDCETEFVVSDETAPEPIFVHEGPEPDVRVDVRSGRTGGADMHVTITIWEPEVAVAGDVLLRAGGDEVELGWMCCRAGTVERLEVSVPSTVVDGDRVEVFLRPGLGILRRPRDMPRIWAGEIVETAVVRAPRGWER